ncbi:MAG TPA: VOC family protein [Actinomycetes bacterium]|jgi:predicted 3-demethylubiquinone-9 3-methyltransferase (glyoxalase superfamily)|nr:VOC family protein [Actinomycetes bacterium]
MRPKITPCLWFDTLAEEAANYYVSVFKNSRIVNVTHYGGAGPREAGLVLTVEFELDGEPFTALNGGPDFTFDEAISFQVDCADQAEVDYFWERLTEDGEEGPCGWAKDKFGVSWQVIPRIMPELMTDPDPARAQRAMAAMLQMSKLDVQALRDAADGA